MSEVILKLHVERLPEGYYLGTSEDIPGLVAQGRTLEETMEIARDVGRKLIESYRERGIDIVSTMTPSTEKMDFLAPVGV